MVLHRYMREVVDAKSSKHFKNKDNNKHFLLVDPEDLYEFDYIRNPSFSRNYSTI